MFSWETQGQSNEIPMKDAGKNEKIKVTAGVQESAQENGPDWRVFTLEEISNNLEDIFYSKIISIPNSYHFKLYSVQLNTNLKKEHCNLQDFPKPNILWQSKLDKMLLIRH